MHELHADELERRVATASLIHFHHSCESASVVASRGAA